MYTIEISTDGINYFEITNVIWDGLTISRKRQENELFYRWDASGKLEVFGDDYDTLKTQIDAGKNSLNCKVYQNEVLQFTGVLLLREKIRILEHRGEFSIKVVDEYTPILDNWNKEVDLSGLITTVDGVSFDKKVNKLIFSLSAGSAGYEAWGTVDGTLFYARQEMEVTPNEKAALEGLDGWVELDADTLVRSWKYSGFPEFSMDYIKSTFEDAVFGGLNQQLPDWLSYLSDKTWLKTKAGLVWNYEYFYLDNKAYYGIQDVTLRAPAYDIKTVIESVVDDFSGTISFDNSGTSDDSFYWMKNSTEYQDVKIVNSSYIIPDNDNDTMVQILNKISLAQIFDGFLKPFMSLYWHVNSNGDFQLLHKTDDARAAISADGNDLTTYKSIDWADGNDEIMFNDEKRYSRIKRNLIAGNADFIGYDMLFAIDKPNIKTIENGNFFTDIEDAFLNPSRYPSKTDNQYFIIAANQVTSNLIYEFTNDATNGFTSVNGSLWAVSETIETIDLVDLTSADTDKKCKSNLFYCVKGETITLEFDWTVTDGVVTTVKLIIYTLQKEESGLTYTFTTSPASGANSFTYQVNDNTYYAIEISAIDSGADSFENITVTTDKNFIPRTGTGKISGKSMDNNGMSISYLDEVCFAEASQAAATVNNASFTFDADEINFFKTLAPIKIPINDFSTDIEPTEYFKTDITSTGRLISANLPCNGDGCTINLEF